MPSFLWRWCGMACSVVDGERVVVLFVFGSQHLSHVAIRSHTGWHFTELLQHHANPPGMLSCLLTTMYLNSAAHACGVVAAQNLSLVTSVLKEYRITSADVTLRCDATGTLL